ncbi:MAG: hypothetical protein WC998_05960, partial [Candidatus Paceibacterota bacterium]
LVYGTRDGKSFASRGTVARGYLLALAKALGVELHPAGTAERLQELEEPRPDDDCLVRALMNMANDETAIARNAQRACNQAAEDSHQANANNLREAARYICRLEARVQALEARPATGAIDYEKVRETVPELEPYSDYDIGGIPTILHYVCEVHPEGLQNCGWVGLCTVHGYIEWAHERACLTTKGIRALTAIDACRAEPAATQPTPEPGPQPAEREPDPLTGDERDLMATLLWVDVTMPQDLPIALSEEAHDHSLIAWQQAVEPNKAGYVLTNAGRMCLEKLQAAPPALAPAPEPEWSEPVSEMDWERCRDLCAKLGWFMYTRHYSDGWASSGASFDNDARVLPGMAETDDGAARLGLEHVARACDRFDTATNRINLDGLEAKISE